MNDNAQAWLRLLDDAEYELCWQNAAEYFRNSVSLEEWKEKGSSARSAVGHLQTRKLKQSHATDDIGVGPKGKYCICEYDCVFSSVGSIVERVTLLQEDDGQYRVIGYYLI